MHYYQFNIGNYRRRTTHLTMLEHGAYKALIDTYYLEEQPLCADIAMLMRTHSARTPDEQQALENVLSDFFTIEGDGYHHKDIDEHIDKYHEKSEKARKSAQARWLKDANGMRPHSEGNANNKPLTTNQEQETINKEQLTKNKQSKPEDQNTMPSKLDGGRGILHHLNIVSGKSFKPVASNLKLISARLKEGHTEAEIIAVIDRKCSEWMNDDKMKQYLRPSTLFNAEKFNAYVGELGVETPEQERSRKLEDWVNGTTPQDDVIEGEVMQ